MMRLYCRKKHGGRTRICAECASLEEYALNRLEKCPLKANKPICKLCEIHCYNPEYRKKIGRIMRFSGPRVIYRHPLLMTHYIGRLVKTKLAMAKRRRHDQRQAG